MSVTHDERREHLIHSFTHTLIQLFTDCSSLLLPPTTTSHQSLPAFSTHSLSHFLTNILNLQPCSPLLVRATPSLTHTHTHSLTHSHLSLQVMQANVETSLVNGFHSILQAIEHIEVTFPNTTHTHCSNHTGLHAHTHTSQLPRPLSRSLFFCSRTAPRLMCCRSYSTETTELPASSGVSLMEYYESICRLQSQSQ